MPNTEHSARLARSLHQVEERYRLTFDKAPIGIVRTSVDGRILSANEYYCALLGRTEEELIGRHFTTLLHPSDADAAAVRYREFIENARPSMSYERRYIRADGTVAWANVTLQSIYDGDRIDHVIVLAQDITERRVAEEALRASKQLLEEAQAIAHLGSWEYELHSGALQWSANLARMIGVAPGDKLDVDAILERIHPDDRPRVATLMRVAHETLEPFVESIRLLDADGQVCHLTLRGHFSFAPDGRPLKVFGVVQDVTEDAQREEELRRRAVQQAAVANLGQIALTCKSLQSLLWQSAAFIRDVLGVEYCHLLQKAGGVFTMIEGAGWTEDIIGSYSFPSSGTPAEMVVQTNAAIVIDDLRTDPRFHRADLLKSKGIVSGMIVPIAFADAEPWGTINAFACRHYPFSNTDVNFMRSVATVIAQAIERERVDAELRRRAEQQSAIALLGREALSSVGPQLFERACELVRSGIDVSFATFSELTDDCTRLRHRAGDEWKAPLHLDVPVTADTQVGLTVLTRETVFVDDYNDDRRFRTSRIAARHGLASGFTVPVASGLRTYGVLSALSQQQRIFTAADAHFVESLANILAEAIEREHSREVIVASEERYRTVVEGASEIIFATDAEGVYVSLNPAFETVTGWPCTWWIGRRFDDLIVPEERDALRAVFNNMRDTKANVTLEVTIIGANERRLLLEVNAFPRVREHEVVGLYGFARDVTEARRAERERQQLTRSMQLLLESTVEGIYTIDVDGRCTSINRAAARLLGALPDEIIGRDMHQLMHTLRADGTVLPEGECPIHRVLHEGSATASTNEIFQRVDGSPMPVSYSAAPIVDGGAIVGAVVCFTDVSERRMLEMKLEQADRLSSLGRLAATIAHEFNNVLMGIAPFVEILRKKPERAPEVIDHIGRSVNRGRRITQDILRFTQPAEPLLSSFEVEPWLQQIAVEARPLVGVAHDVRVLAEHSLCVRADSALLHQIFMNLILNARDAMERGGSIAIEAVHEPEVARFAFGAVDRPERFVHFVVRDTGCGMSAETLRHVFEPLFTTKKNGTGLGLSVTHQVVLRHGGQIFVESTPDVGTTFHIFIPRADADERREPFAGEPAGEVPHSRHVLLVEDDEAVAAGLIALLELESMTVDLVTSGGAAIDYLSRSRPDVVLLDVGLPDMDGTKVYARIAEMHPTLPVVFSTGHADRARLDDVLTAPHVTCLLKPYDLGSLRAALDSVDS